MEEDWAEWKELVEQEFNYVEDSSKESFLLSMRINKINRNGGKKETEY